MAKFWLTPVALASSTGFSAEELTKLSRLVQENAAKFMEAWNSLALKSEPRAEQVHCTEDELVVVLMDGRTLSVPLAWFPRLANASARQRSKYELLGNGSGIHWPMMDEDVSISGLLMGNPSIELRQRPPGRSSGRSRSRAAER